MTSAVSPSDLFMDAFGMGIGSPSITCSCGHRHHAPESQFIDDKEQDEMLEDARQNPKAVEIHNNTDAVSAREIGGITVVIECPCNWLGRFERIIWMERERILRYYRKRRDADAAATAELDSALAEQPSNGGAGK